VKSEILLFDSVLFDMDGLMIDEAMFGKMLGLRQAECARLVCEWLGLSVEPGELARQRNELFSSMLPGRLRALPGLFDLVEWLQAHHVPRALVTSGLSSYVKVVLRHLSLDGVFNVIVTGEDVSHGKPAPECYQLAAHRLGLPPASCLVLEDAPNGLAAAKAAGMTCWAVPNEHTRSLDLSTAELVLPSLHAVRDELARRWRQPG
jgi:HAD superfamily hydrolase (TIGR01509 family)